jgi:hypothetical protein
MPQASANWTRYSRTSAASSASQGLGRRLDQVVIDLAVGNPLQLSGEFTHLADEGQGQVAGRMKPLPVPASSELAQAVGEQLELIWHRGTLVVARRAPVKWLAEGQGT